MERTEDNDELEADIDDEDALRPGYRAALESGVPVVRLTTALWQQRERLGLSVDEVAARGLRIEDVEAIDDNDVDVPVEIMSRYAAARRLPARSPTRFAPDGRRSTVPAVDVIRCILDV